MKKKAKKPVIQGLLKAKQVATRHPVQRQTQLAFEFSERP